MRVFVASDSSDTIEDIIIKLSTVSAPDMVMHHVLMILTLTSTQGRINLNHDNNKCLIISEIIQAITFAVKIVRLKVYMTIAHSITLTLQGHKCASNWTTFELAIYRTIFKLSRSSLAWQYTYT